FSTIEDRLLSLTRKYLHLFPTLSLIAVLEPENEQYFQSSFEKHFLSNAKNSSEKIKCGEIISGVRMIKGTGFGLTPSGDDFIAGILFGTFFTETKYNTDLSWLRSEIVEMTESSNQLTNSFIRNASVGYFYHALKNLLHLSPQNFDFENRLTAVLSIGETSGADLLAGFIFSIKNNIGT
ncbi:MAG: DUF2877 domain-containing protein, partial [Bacteroidales bacterium]|nr:DUF2877 domain-containing protein [Bacteroidales bacterium]